MYQELSYIVTVTPNPLETGEFKTNSIQSFDHDPHSTIIVHSTFIFKNL